MLFQLLAGGCIGAVAGVVTSIIPGLGTIHGSIACTVINFVSPIAAAAAQVTNYVVGTLLASAKESLSPATSGNAEMLAAAEQAQVIDPIKQTQSLFMGKIVGCILGTLLGIFIGGSIISFSGLPALTPWVVGFILILMAATLSHQWPLIIGVFIGSQIIFKLAPMFGITNIVFVLGAAIWVIPGCIDAMSEKTEFVNEGEVSHIFWPDPLKLIMGSLLAISAPGVSPSFIINGLTSKGNQLSQITLAAAETFVTCYGLVALLSGTVTGKAGLVVELAAIGVLPGIWMFILMAAGAYLAWQLLTWVYQMNREVTKLPGIHFIALVLSVLTLIICGGLFGLLLMPVGIGLHQWMKANGCPQTIKALIWSAPVL